MGLLTNRAKVLEQKPLTFMESLYLPAILKGMAITFSHMFKKKPTISYPEERMESEKHLYREEKYAAKYEINMLRCIFCGLCEEACPKDAIYMSETFAPSNFTRKGFIYSKDELLIPNPVNEKEKYELAKGKREAQLKNK